MKIRLALQGGMQGKDVLLAVGNEAAETGDLGVRHC